VSHPRLRRYAAVAIAALAVTLLSVEPALAGKKPKIVATVNGKRYKWKGRWVVAGYSGSGTIIVASKPARPGGIVRALGFGCAIYPPNETFPVTPPVEICNANYTETRVGRNVTIKGWLAVSGVRVTYEYFDGTRLGGTFTATLDPVTGTVAGPITIEGTFDTRPQADQ